MAIFLQPNFLGITPGKEKPLSAGDQLILGEQEVVWETQTVRALTILKVLSEKAVSIDTEIRDQDNNLLSNWRNKTLARDRINDEVFQLTDCTLTTWRIFYRSRE